MLRETGDVRIVGPVPKISPSTVKKIKNWKLRRARNAFGHHDPILHRAVESNTVKANVPHRHIRRESGVINWHFLGFLLTARKLENNR